MGTKDSNSFKNPPVIETVLGIQFERLAQFSNAHAGAFWQNHLSKTWPVVTYVDQPRLEDQFERFGEERKWSRLGFEIRESRGSSRVQIVREDGERMIQLQDSRFIYNWQKKKGQYPSYEPLALEFNDLFAKFRTFASDARLGEIEPNQWEITYIDKIPMGLLWSNLDEWARVFPNLYIPKGCDSLTMHWSVPIQVDRGRLFVQISPAKFDDEEEGILLSWTARGPLTRDREMSATAGFELGHDSIVAHFMELVSQEAKDQWSRS